MNWAEKWHLQNYDKQFQMKQNVMHVEIQLL